MANGEQWRSSEVLAFTEREGPGRPPGGASNWAIGTLAGVLAVTFVGVMASDSLCPEHRAWAQALAGFAFFGVGAAFVALWRGWAGAPLLTMTAAATGVVLGLLDAAHAPTRGRLIALGFAVATVLSSAMAWRAHRLTRWDRAAAAASSVGDETLAAPSPSESTPADREVPTPQ